MHGIKYELWFEKNAIWIEWVIYIYKDKDKINFISGKKQPIYTS